MPSEKRELDELVDRFAAEMKKKLRAKHRKGYRGWDDPEMLLDLGKMFSAHVERAWGEPRQWIDVANLAAFIWHQLGEPGDQDA